MEVVASSSSPTLFLLVPPSELDALAYAQQVLMRDFAAFRAWEALMLCTLLFTSTTGIALLLCRRRRRRARTVIVDATVVPEEEEETLPYSKGEARV